MTKPKLIERTRACAHAGSIVATQAAQAMVVCTLAEAYVCVKLIAIPIAMVEAFIRPYQWSPPWHFL
jgi:hypothetical protein